MKCVKTGVDLFLQSKSVYIHGDMFVPFVDGGLQNDDLGLGMFNRNAREIGERASTMFDGVGVGVNIDVNFVVNCSAIHSEPITSRIHVIAGTDDHFFDRGAGQAILFVCANKARWFGYNGLDLKTAFSV